MNDEKLEDFKVMSATAAIIFGCGTAIGIGAEIDAYKNGGVSILPLLLIFSILTVISLIMALVSGHILKKRQGEEYFSAKDYITGFISMWFPNLTASHSAELRQLNVSDDNKKTKLWKRLCSGYDLDCIISFILWFSLWSLCVWMLIRCIFFSNVTDKIFEIVCYSIVVIMILVVLICVGSGIKKNPLPLFEYISLSGKKFSLLARHFDNAKRIIHKAWMDNEYVFIQAVGKAYCFPIKHYEEMTINFSRFRFVMVLTTRYECIIRSSLSPFGFLILKKQLENRTKIKKI